MVARWGRALVFALLALAFVSAAQQKPTVTTFVLQPEDGGPPVTVRLTSTPAVSPKAIDLLRRSIRVSRIDKLAPAERALIVPDSKAAKKFDPTHAEIQVSASSKDGAQWAWSWPDSFELVRPGVLGVVPMPAVTTPAQLPPGGGIGILHTADHGAPHHATGRLMCRTGTMPVTTVPVPFMKVVIAGQGTQTRADGTFQIDQRFPGIPGTLFLAFEGTGQFGPHAIPMQIFDDAHVTRSERVDRDPTVTGETADFGDVEVPGTDCILWGHANRALQRYVDIMGNPPPTRALRIKRWSAVPLSVGAPHTFYDYIILPTDTATGRTVRTVFHEFGHSIAFVADGSKSHWDWDNLRFIYGRFHNASVIGNKGAAFIEGWADYWASASAGDAPPSPTECNAATDGFLDFNEGRITTRLRCMADALPSTHSAMVQLFLDSPGRLHTLGEFETAYCAAAPAGNPFCQGGLALRQPPSCPPGYHDDGLTCRLINIVPKPSQARGAGSVPNACGPGQEFDAGLCYPRCPSGFHGVGPVCWQACPSGFHDDGATCRRDGNIISADNSACPWYDKCGLVTARGCSTCPAGFHNDGCTCRIDPQITAKASQGRGVGTVPPRACAAGQQMDAGLCYAACAAGFTGVGPVCWGSCPAGFDDHGATCYRAPHVFADDPVIPP